MGLNYHMLLPVTMCGIVDIFRARSRYRSYETQSNLVMIATYYEYKLQLIKSYIMHAVNSPERVIITSSNQP